MSSDRQRSLLVAWGLALLGVQLLLILITALVLWPLAGRHIDERAVDDAANIVTQLGTTYGELLRDGQREGDLEGLGVAVRRDAQLLNARITVFEGADHVLYDSNEASSPLDQPWRRPEVARAIAESSAALVRVDLFTDEPYVFAATRLSADADRQVTLRYGRSLAAEYAWLAGIGWSLTLAAIGLVGITAGGLALMAGRMRQRTRAIAAQVDQVAAGNLRTRFPSDEVAELMPIARSLNTLARRMSDHVDQLQSQQSMHKAILHSMSSAVIALDLEQRILDMNAAAEQLIGAKADDSRGRLLHEVVMNARLHRYVDDFMRDAARLPIEFSIDPEGQTRIEAIGEQLIAADGRPRGMLIILNDVTRLRRLESLRSDFAANVSHELRTPITNIKGYVETLLEVGFEDAEQARRFLDIVDKNSSRLAAIIEDVMTLAKLEQPSARDTLERTRRTVSSIISPVIAQFERVAEAKQIAINTDVPDDLAVTVHGPLIEQAIGNLLSNAINYSPPKTQVLIRAAAAGRKVEISVIDKGPGIAQQHLPRLFERFYRVDKARSREVGGTGLGLALVKHIALAHHGEVRVTSELGKGSAFTIVLPAD